VTFRFKTAHALFLPVILLGIGGCTQNSASSADGYGNPLKNLAGSFLAARSFDKVMVALKSDDQQKLKAASVDLQQAAKSKGNEYILPISIQSLANSGLYEDSRAMLAEASEKPLLIKTADKNYAAALSLLPTDYQKIAELDLDSTTLNTLGYNLADRGKKPADFQLAEFLTAASLAKQDKAIKSLPADDPRMEELLLSRAVGAGDSKAWALYKQGRYAQARSEQEKVIEIAAQYSLSLKQNLTPDLLFHLGEIYAALDELSLAQSSYEAALLLSPDDELKAKIELRLSAIENARIS